MTYKVKEIYYTLQGEGHHTGRPAVFCRFSGCNLWSGREEDRSTAICTFCDTDFRGTDGENGGRYAAEALARQVRALWPTNTHDDATPYVVCTGGEPLLQLDEELIHAFHRSGLTVAVETNGTQPLPDGIDWVCMSPKPHTDIVVTSGDELKLVYPQAELPPSLFEGYDFTHFYLQPMENERWDQNTAATLQYCLEHPLWHLSLQMHKYVGIK